MRFLLQGALLNTLNIYIFGNDSYCLYPLLDYFENTGDNHFSIFFVRKKYPNLSASDNVSLFDFPETITPEWLGALYNFSQKIKASTVRIHSAIHHAEKIIYPLLKIFQQKSNAEFAIPLFFYETRISDVISRQEYSRFLNNELSPQAYIKKLEQNLLSDSAECNVAYKYIFNGLTDAKYYILACDKTHHEKFSSITPYSCLSELYAGISHGTVKKTLSALGIEDNVINTIRDICSDKKTLFYVDDGLKHPLGNTSKEECLLTEISKNGFECIFLLNYTGKLNSVSDASVAIIPLPDNITLEVLMLAGVNPESVYGFCLLDLFYAKKSSIKKIFFHEHEFYNDNRVLIKYIGESEYKDIPVLYINEAQKRLVNSSTPKQIFLLAESMGDVLFAAGGLNALRNKLTGRFVCIVPKVYHSLLSLCPWVDDLWDPESVNNEQLEDIYIARVLGNFHLPSHVQHILDKKHQIDSFLTFLGHKDTVGSLKEIVLSLDAIDKTQVDNFLKMNKLERKIVLIHPNVGVPNRTWPRQSWAELIEKFIHDGWSVVLIGSNNNFYAHKKAVEIHDHRVFNAIDKFTMAETIYLMTKASLLVACDSGPVALAGATNIAICALYSVVPGKYRLPYRHGKAGWNALAIDRTCQYYHCANHYSLDSGETFDAWCPNNKLYSCMNQYKSDDFYREITRFLCSARFIDQVSYKGLSGELKS